MFCPNCAAANSEDHSYCRRCGLKLDAIAKTMAEQFPSAEYSAIARRIHTFEVVGVFSISIAGFIGLCMLIAKAFYYKLQLFGPDVLFYAAFGALIFFGLFSVFCFNYKALVSFEKLNPRLPAPDHDSPVQTKKLLADTPFQPASIIEHSTELLPRERQ